MQYPLCRHIHANGVQCGSPALATEIFCFFHHKLHQRHQGFRHTPETRGYLIAGQHLELAPIEGRESVQLALSVVINAIATGQIDTRRGTALLYGLQLASANAPRPGQGARAYQPRPEAVVRNAQQSPEGLDLASPGALTEDFDED
jgi:hypothetical protein